MKFLLSTSDTNVKFVLIKKNNDENERIVEFTVDLGELVLLCEDLSKARIKNYPIIIFEFTEGFYTTKDLYVNNTYNYELDPFNNVLSSFSIYKGFNNTQKDKNLFNSPVNKMLKESKTQRLSMMLPSLSSTFNKREVKFSSMNEKFKQYEFFDKQLRVQKVDKSEKIKILDSKLKVAQEKLEKCYKNYQMTFNINKMRNQIYSIQEKINNFESTIELLKKNISQKQSDLHISSSIFFINKENYKEKVQYIEKNYKKIEKYKIMYNSFKNKKLIEVANFFFNKLSHRIYLTPPFYISPFDANNQKIRFQYYDKNTKELAVMMGSVSNMCNYLSKLFNIPLKYPYFINGSRSFIVKDKKE